MANIYDYLQWRADITFDMRPFNDVDNLVLSTLVYLDFSGIVPSEDQGESVSLRHACKALLRKGGGDVSPFMRSFFELDPDFVRQVASSTRFGNTQLSAYADTVDKKRALQFAAMQFDLPHVGTYVGFRGTDTTLVGWQENLMTSFRITAAQEEAARYLERAIMRMDAQEQGRLILVGGHSKGANLAEYAASHCPAHLQNRISRVYSNDGPGMAPEVMPQSPRQILKDKLRLIVPAYSVVGMLFARAGESRTIVASTGSGIDQHDMTTWQVLRTSLQEVDELSPECLPLNKTFATWIDSIPLDERERVTNEVFDALKAGGASTFQQIGSSPEGVQQVVRALGNTDERTRKVGLDLLQKILDTSVGAVRFATKRALEDAVRRLRGTKPLRAGIIQTHKNRPGLRVFIDA